MSPGPTQLIIILVIVLLLFGAKKIPELAKGLGTGMREFRQGASGELEDEKDSETDSKTDSKADNDSSDSKGSNGDNGNIRSEDETSEEKASKTEQRS